MLQPKVGTAEYHLPLLDLETDTFIFIHTRSVPGAVFVNGKGFVEGFHTSISARVITRSDL